MSNKLQTNCDIPSSVRVMPFTNLYGCTIGEDCFVGPFVEIGGAIIGQRTYISSHSYICPGVTIGDDCFIAHGVMFTNDIFRDTPDWESPLDKKFVMRNTSVGNHVRIGSGAVILPVSIGDHCIIGAGSVVTHDMPSGSTWAGNPAREMKHRFVLPPEIGAQFD